MKTKILFAIIPILFSPSVFSDTGEVLFNNLCSSCHKVQGESGIAPPVFGVINHVKRAYPNRDDFIQTVVDWVDNPSQDKALMPGAINKFGLMPKLGYPKEQVTEIAQYLFDAKFKPPGWYKKHYEEEHGTSH